MAILVHLLMELLSFFCDRFYSFLKITLRNVEPLNKALCITYLLPIALVLALSRTGRNQYHAAGVLVATPLQ